MISKVIASEIAIDSAKLGISAGAVAYAVGSLSVQNRSIKALRVVAFISTALFAGSSIVGELKSINSISNRAEKYRHIDPDKVRIALDMQEADLSWDK